MNDVERYDSTPAGAVTGIVGEPATTAGQAAISDALLHAAAVAREPTLVVGGPRDRLEILWANRAFADAVSAEVVDLADVPLSSVLSSATGELPLNELRVAEVVVTLTPRVGPTTAWDATAYPSPGPSGATWVVTLRRSGALHDSEHLLRASEQRFRALSERAPIGIFSSEVGLRLGYVNDWFAGLVGYPAEHLLGTGWMDIVEAGDRDAVCSGLQQALSGLAMEVPARLNTADGDERWVTIRAVPCHTPDSPAAFLGTVEDVTDRRRFEQLLSWQATHDPLTGLPNRSRLIESIDVALSDALASSCDDVAVLFVDLDDFKAVNDSLGHAAGDQLLSEVATRLRSVTRAPDEVFRFAGDEFVVVVRDATSPDIALTIANRLRAAVSAPIDLAGHTMTVQCSVGVVLAGRGASPDDLIRDADVAMYAAKRNGKGTTAIFDPVDREGHAVPHLVGEPQS